MLSVTALRDSQRNIDGFLSIAIDITERKQMYEAVQSSEKRLLLSAEAAKMGLWDWNIITGDVIWSDQCKAHYGISPETPMTYELFLQAFCGI